MKIAKRENHFILIESERHQVIKNLKGNIEILEKEIVPVFISFIAMEKTVV